jgi:dolichol-phosphate mannosyltransferase
MGKVNGKTLLFIPTYNERENIGPLFEKIQTVGLDTDILLLDDNSPDGTGKIMDDIAAIHPHVSVIHRSGKLGIGSAHKDGILYAYREGYRTLITMDADFTHNPERIPDLLAVKDKGDLVVASRYMQPESLPGWNLFRKFMTTLGHFLLKNLLGIENDATGALRVYRLDRIPKEFVSLVKSDGYSFFFESLYVLVRGDYKIVEVPIQLTPRTYGSSKMTVKDIYKSVRQLLDLWFQTMFKKNPWTELRRLNG